MMIMMVDLVQTPRSSGRGCAAQRQLRRVLEIWIQASERGRAVIVLECWPACEWWEQLQYAW